MTTKHHLSHAEELYWGTAHYAPAHTQDARRGARMTPLTQVAIGSPIALDVNGMADGATSTELPNNATVTWTTADDGASPFDNADTPAVASIVDATGATRSVWPLDVPRNLTIQVTHLSSIVAMSVTVTGFDQYGEKMVETLSVTATGTDKSAAGKKAFKSILSMAVTSADNATTNTLNLGWGDVLGLPYRIGANADVLSVFFNDAPDAAATVVKADATTPTATTGDVRGTVDTTSAANGSRVIVWMKLEPANRNSLFGLEQYAG